MDFTSSYAMRRLGPLLVVLAVACAPEAVVPPPSPSVSHRTASPAPGGVPGTYTDAAAAVRFTSRVPLYATPAELQSDGATSPAIFTTYRPGEAVDRASDVVVRISVARRPTGEDLETFARQRLGENDARSEPLPAFDGLLLEGSFHPLGPARVALVPRSPELLLMISATPTSSSRIALFDEIIGSLELDPLWPRQMPEAEARELLGARDRAVLAALARRDGAALAAIAHPTKGVRFSAYPAVRPERDVRLSRAELEIAFEDPTVRLWGATDGQGEEIAGTFAAYWSRFVYDRDFANAPEVTFNRILGAGNTIDNTPELHPDAVLVDHHFASSEGTLDWKGLRLLFERHEGAWYLVAVVHASWTI